MKRADVLIMWACIVLVLAPFAMAQNEHAFVWSSSTAWSI
jgi:hypothetical protein